MEIYLIRHGECAVSLPEYYDDQKKTMNPPLTEKGITQAGKLADRLSTIPFEVIYSSDLERAIKTAEIINAKVHADRVCTASFREIDMGDVGRKPWSEFPEIHAQWSLHKEDISYPNGENGNDVWLRCKKELESIIRSEYKRVAIICHGGTIRSITCGLLRIPQQRRFHLGMPPEHCSVSIIRLIKGEFYLHTFNDYSHI
jgi:broad specificity phosphatase PhoE